MFATGAGIVTFTLFPLAIPIIALTLAFTIPLVVIGLAVGLVVTICAAPVVLLRRILTRHSVAQTPPPRRADGVPRAGRNRPDSSSLVSRRGQVLHR